ncbi:hypothetical protein ACWCV3_28460, partial [Streptomyces sp. NPDC001781]
DVSAGVDGPLAGAGSVIGRDRVGIYGGYYPVKRALDAGKATWAWQTVAWSGGQWDARAVIRQGLQKTINGVSCDLNTATAEDYGQWTPGKTPTTQQQEADSPVATSNDVKTLFQTDNVLASPDGDKDPKGNKFWTAESYLRYGYLQDRDTQALVKALAAKMDALAKTNATLVDAVAKLSANVGGLDAQAIVDKLTAAIESIDVRLDVTPSPAA